MQEFGSQLGEQKQDGDTAIDGEVEVQGERDVKLESQLWEGYQGMAIEVLVYRNEGKRGAVDVNESEQLVEWDNGEGKANKANVHGAIGERVTNLEDPEPIAN